jgi:thiosulfate reductase cytochrome b subunit
LEIGEYLQKPDHQFARGQSAQYTIAPELKATMRRCEACHDAATTHDWLPYVERHMSEVACETCHIPRLYAPAIQQYDWTVLRTNGEPINVCRGIEATASSVIASADASAGIPPTVSHLVTGFEPVLLPRQNVEDGQTMLAPYNLISTWYWVYVDANGSTRPVRQADLQAAWLDRGAYAPEVLTTFDANGDGALTDPELKLDTPEKTARIASRLQALGLANPHILGEVQPYSINHDATRGEWAVKDCGVCHGATSRVTQPMELAAYLPGGVRPEFVKDANTQISGELYEDGGALFYRPATTAQRLYVFGHDRVPWVDWAGALAFVSVLAGVTAHGGLRVYAALRQPHPRPRVKRVYMYAVYERFWHWLQTFTIVLLLLTGLVIHRPDMFGLFSFPHVVVVHNVLAAILVINAALSLFYHLASGEIRQYLPRPYGFFDQAILQAKYYLRGIFRRERHPFEKTPQKKLNPLQQATYFGILNVLLPLQIITGALMWGVQTWPQGAGWLGGLPFLAPLHSLSAWLFAAFIVAHVYLTTTGHAPLASVKAMMLGWDEVEDHAAHEAQSIEETPDHDHPGTIQTPTPAP